MICYPLPVGGIDTRVIEARASDVVSARIVLVHGTGGRADRWLRNVDDLVAAASGVEYH